MADLQKFAARYDVSPEALRRWLVEAMLLGAVSDGEIAQREAEAIIAHLQERPELAGIQPQELRKDLDMAWRGLEADGFQVRLHALAGALPRYAHRVLAYRAAVVVAFADGKLMQDEVGFLREMQKAFGIVEADVERAFVDAERGAEAIPDEFEPIEAYLDVLLLAAAADGQVTVDEQIMLQAFVMERPEFEGLSEEMLHQYLQGELQRFAREGAELRLSTLPDELVDPIQRLNAYGLAEEMVMADGELDGTEQRLLQRLAEVLDIEGARNSIAGDADDDADFAG